MVYEQSPFEYADPHNGRWVYGVSAPTLPSDRAIRTYHLLSCGNDGYDKGCRENYDGYAKNGTITPMTDAEAMIRLQPAGSSHFLMTVVAFFVWAIGLERSLPLLQRDDA